MYVYVCVRGEGGVVGCPWLGDLFTTSPASQGPTPCDGCGMWGTQPVSQCRMSIFMKEKKEKKRHCCISPSLIFPVCHVEFKKCPMAC